MQAERTTIQLFRNSDEAVSFPAGSVIFASGDHATVMFVIKSGTVRLEYNGKPFETIETGDILGEMALLSSEPRSMTAVAETSVELVAIDEDRFQFLIQQTPYFALDVMRIMAERLRRLNSRV